MSHPGGRPKGSFSLPQGVCTWCKKSRSIPPRTGGLCLYCWHQGRHPGEVRSSAQIRAQEIRHETKVLTYDKNRLAKLVKATNHVAPYIHQCTPDRSQAVAAAYIVVRAYRDGKIMTLDKDLLMVAAGRKVRHHDRAGYTMRRSSSGDDENGS